MNLKIVTFTSFFASLLSTTVFCESGSDFSLVGVVEGKKSSVIVLKDKDSGKTFHLSGGDTLPNNPEYKLKSIERKYVVYADDFSEVKIYTTPEKFAEEKPLPVFEDRFIPQKVEKEPPRKIDAVPPPPPLPPIQELPYKDFYDEEDDWYSY